MRTRIPHLPQLIRSAAPAADLVPDRALLAEFVTSKSGIAFELLVRRHGPTVWAVCRRHLANTHDAEDAFQATFLVLAKSAARIAKHASVGGWLYGVAYRVALKARRSAARRKRVETAVAPTEEPTTLPVFSPNDTAAVIHAELEKLPDRYRLPVLLCDLEGLSRKEAATQLGWSEGTLSGRLNRARKLLAGRLTVRGVAAGVLAAVGTAVTPPALATTTAAVGVGLSVIGVPSSATTDAVATLAHGAMRDMTRSLILKTAGVLLAASVLLTGGLFGLRFDTTPQATAAPVPKAEMAKPEDVTDALAELLGQPAVQRELKLSAEQRVTLIDGFEKLLEEWQQTGLTKNPWKSGAQAPPPPSDFAAWEKYETGVRQLVAGTITKAQLRRLQQAEVQVLGLNALRLKRVQTELGLTDDQKKAVSAAVASALSGGAVGDPAINPPNAAQLGGGMVPGVGVEPGDPHRRAAAALAEVAAGFTTAQASRWKELAGEKVGFNVTRVTNQCQAVFGQLPAAATGDEGLTVPPAPPILPPPALPNAPLPQLPPPAVAPPALTPLAPPPAQLPPPAAPVKK